MTEPRFRAADGYYLYDRNSELLCGPIEEIHAFAAALNANPPTDQASLRVRVMELIQSAGAGPFKLGPALRQPAGESAAAGAAAGPFKIGRALKASMRPPIAGRKTAAAEPMTACPDHGDKVAQGSKP